MYILFLFFVLWAVMHTLTASHTLKNWVRRRVGDAAYEGGYRLVYNVVATVTLLPIWGAIHMLRPNPLVWEWEGVWRVVGYGVQLAGVVGLGVSLWQTDVWSFAGVRQFVHWLRGRPAVAETSVLVTNGTYSIVRHPLYFFSLLFLWGTPTLSRNSAIFALFTTLYFWLGSYPEERKLRATFGDAYRQYQSRVPRLLPLPWWRRTQDTAY